MKFYEKYVFLLLGTPKMSKLPFYSENNSVSINRLASTQNGQ